MPLYEYKCKKCKHRLEVIQKVNDSPLGACPKCGGKLEKLVSSPAIQFKGSGWYITDYAHKNTPSKESKSKEKPKSEASKEPAAKNVPSEKKTG
jgi:putative FmdB family regulatory protein